jgi:4-hydroxy-tetrahydrodipicolinate synthase
MRASGAVDLAATQASIDRLIINGVSGIIVLPMLGENASLTQGERDAVVTAAREAVAGRVPMLSGLAELSTADARRAARNYARLGAEGLMVFPSLAYRTDRAETVAWYTAVAAEGLPVMITSRSRAVNRRSLPSARRIVLDGRPTPGANDGAAACVSARP